MLPATHPGRAALEPRRFTRAPAHVRCWCESTDLTVFAPLGDLSEGGTFLKTSTPLEKGSEVLIRVGSKGIEISARVVWIRREGQGGPTGMGLKFEGLSDGARRWIRELLEEEHSPSPSQIGN